MIMLVLPAREKMLSQCLYHSSWKSTHFCTSAPPSRLRTSTLFFIFSFLTLAQFVGFLSSDSLNIRFGAMLAALPGSTGKAGKNGKVAAPLSTLTIAEKVREDLIDVCKI